MKRNNSADRQHAKKKQEFHLDGRIVHCLSTTKRDIAVVTESAIIGISRIASVSNKAIVNWERIVHFEHSQSKTRSTGPCNNGYCKW